MSNTGGYVPTSPLLIAESSASSRVYSVTGQNGRSMGGGEMPNVASAGMIDPFGDGFGVSREDESSERGWHSVAGEGNERHHHRKDSYVALYEDDPDASCGSLAPNFIGARLRRVALSPLPRRREPAVSGRLGALCSG